MTLQSPDTAVPTLMGRSSSHFTRIVRVFAAETRTAHTLHVVRDLMSSDVKDYGGNPALRIPTWKTEQGSWFGALNICRELCRRASNPPRVVWPEDLTEPLPANAQELILQAMSTEVSLVMAKAGGASEGGAHPAKQRQSLLNMLAWLEENTPAALAALPRERDLSFLEVSLYCLVMHLEFRGVLSMAPYAALNAFCQRFGTRASIAETAFQFDP
ncbi:glutathione S-transferase domain-containing protein [Corallococcus sp. H22C18031201]|uniref:glutathione S-transferase domain-containing protein n=1 Tax=Citreicoccus inhibens TaxID=2849499 RepID=UPI000E770786|nr:glutathione S-transferase domain-containing protein [Citreicoccus inhibens]MBU8894009.1 glutathione S-transferase domain-containing protein [Citreicoccus inhibens]RJS23267.1 glutathione S-transferase domain-containing protein [Corallococcus sp. H22C18031201]